MCSKITDSEIIFKYTKNKIKTTYHIYKLEKKDNENIIWWKQKNSVIGGSLELWLHKFIKLSSITFYNKIKEKSILYKHKKKNYIIRNPTNEDILKLYNIYK